MLFQEEPDPEEPFNFKIWCEAPPEVDDPFALADGEAPLIIEPEEAIAARPGGGVLGG